MNGITINASLAVVWMVAAAFGHITPVSIGLLVIHAFFAFAFFITRRAD